MTLESFWFVVIAVLWCGFFVLEGFDFGVGMLHRVLARNEQEARVAINTVGPWWDGNEVWLIVGGAAIFAAFPSWYATWFSAGYLALLCVLAALIVRGVSFEYRHKVDGHAWRGIWSWGLSVSSLLVPMVLGVALGDLLAGLPIDQNQEFTGDFWDLFTPYGVLFGVTLTVLSAVHGSTFLSIRTLGDLRTRAGRTAGILAIPAVVLLLILAAATGSVADAWQGVLMPLVAAAAVIIAGIASRRHRERTAFVSTAIAIAATVGTVFANLYPSVMVSSTSSAFNLTVSNTASGSYALTVMTVVVVLFLPIVLLYQGWSFWVFRRRLEAPGPQSNPEPHEAVGSSG